MRLRCLPIRLHFGGCWLRRKFKLDHGRHRAQKQRSFPRRWIFWRKWRSCYVSASEFRSDITPELNIIPRYHLRNCTFENNVATSSAGAIITAGQAIVDLDGAVFTNVSNFPQFPLKTTNSNRTGQQTEERFKQLSVLSFIWRTPSLLATRPASK